jgi:DNA polymerase
MLVPNYFPKHPGDSRLAIIGEAPGADEDKIGIPFMGASGRFLNSLLASVGINRDMCFLGNVSQVRPRGNDIALMDWSGTEIQSGLAQLRKDLNSFNPNLVVLLGNVPLKAALDPDTIHPLFPGKFKHSVSSYRGSVFIVSNLNSPFYGYKCIPTYHPTYAIRDYSVTPIIKLDLGRAAKERLTSTYSPPTRTRWIPRNTECSLLLSRLHNLISRPRAIALDIEGGIGTMSCISFAVGPSDSFIIPFTNAFGGSYWSLEDEIAIWSALRAVLLDPRVPKILQNSLYDRFVLQYSYHTPMVNVSDDTMLKHWELYCELEKGLGFQTSIYTTEPYYKNDRKSSDLETHLRYCCTDSLVTYEISSVLDKQLLQFPQSLAHYRFNVDLLRPMLYMELRGIKYDSALAKQRRDKLITETFELQAQLDELAGVGIPEKIAYHDLVAKAANALVKKKFAPSIKHLSELADLSIIYAGTDSFPAPDYAVSISREPITTDSNGISILSARQRGMFSTYTKTCLNIKSPDFKDYLYVKKSLPIQLDKKKNVPTTDYEALLKLYKKTGSLECKLAIEISARRTHSQMLAIHADNDGRIRCGYNAVGTETGRVTCYTSPTGSGYNLQTIPECDRDLFIADDDHWFFQCDLSGADGWTVAARLASLGERTMLDDYLFGLKPAKILCYMLRHGAGSLDGKTRDEIAHLTDEVKKTDWDYFACKIGQHGTSYLMAERTLSDNIFAQSEGAVYVPPTLTQEMIRSCDRAGKPYPMTCADLQKLFKRRYRIVLWHNWMRTNLERKAAFVSACGQRRVFFGRRDDLLGQALAHEPQVNTTYATNRAVLNLWNDPENRRPNGGLYIEPLHQVHDALCGQFSKDRTTWAISRIRSYFSNILRIGNVDVTIPFEGAYGTSWGCLKQGKI